MERYKEEFIELMLEAGVLLFGDFTAKSGRKTPYFINTGNFKTGKHMARLSAYYAQCYAANVGKDSTVLFGPAYKGIPLATAVSVALARDFGIDCKISFNRKEAKDHGEGGVIVGYTPQPGDRLVIVEDVITAGTAVRESMEILKAFPDAKVTDLLIAADRMEKGQGTLSAVQEVEKEHGIKVHPVVNIREILAYLHNREVGGRVYINDDMKARIDAYLEQYGA